MLFKKTTFLLLTNVIFIQCLPQIENATEVQEQNQIIVEEQGQEPTVEQVEQIGQTENRTFDQDVQNIEQSFGNETTQDGKKITQRDTLRTATAEAAQIIKELLQNVSRNDLYAAESQANQNAGQYEYQKQQILNGQRAHSSSSQIGNVQNQVSQNLVGNTLQDNLNTVESHSIAGVQKPITGNVQTTKQNAGAVTQVSHNIIDNTASEVANILYNQGKLNTVQVHTNNVQQNQVHSNSNGIQENNAHQIHDVQQNQYTGNTATEVANVLYNKNDIQNNQVQGNSNTGQYQQHSAHLNLGTRRQVYQNNVEQNIVQNAQQHNHINQGSLVQHQNQVLNNANTVHTQQNQGVQHVGSEGQVQHSNLAQNVVQTAQQQNRVDQANLVQYNAPQSNKNVQQNQRVQQNVGINNQEYHNTVQQNLIDVQTQQNQVHGVQQNAGTGNYISHGNAQNNWAAIHSAQQQSNSNSAANHASQVHGVQSQLHSSSSTAYHGGQAHGVQENSVQNNWNGIQTNQQNHVQQNHAGHATQGFFENYQQHTASQVSQANTIENTATQLAKIIFDAAYKQSTNQYSNGHQNSIYQSLDQAANQNARYHFATLINDNINGNYQERNEHRANGKVTGYYSYDDGHVFRTVSYVADDKGYRVLSDEVKPSLKARTAPNGIAEVKLYRDGRLIEYTIGNGYNRPALVRGDLQDPH